MLDEIDAVVYHPQRQAAYFFRGDEYVKYIPTQGVEEIRGSKTRRIAVDGWRSLPVEFRSDIDAAFTYSNAHIYFFKGSRYVKYKPGEGVVPMGSGRVIREIGVDGWRSFPAEFRSGINAAIFYPENNHAYFFKGDKYIKYKPASTGVVTHDNGRAIRDLGVTGWQDLPQSFKRGIDAAFYYPSSEVLYFFRGREYVRWVPGEGVPPRYPRRIGLQQREFGGWPGLSTLLGGPSVGNVTSDSATVWIWLAGGKRTDEILVRLDDSDVRNPLFSPPSAGTSVTDLLEGIEGVDRGSSIQLLRFSGLSAGSSHAVELCRSDNRSVIERVEFKTAPFCNDPARIRIAVGSCSNMTRQASVRCYSGIAGKEPDLVILCGDNCYYASGDEKSSSRNSVGTGHDWGSVAKMLKRQLEARNHPQFVQIARSAPLFATWDDHDFSYNNCDGFKDRNDSRWVGRNVSAAVQRAMWPHPYRNDGNHIYCDSRWGPLHLFLTDGRFHSNRDDGILGGPQVDWLLSGLKSSTAPIKIVAFGSQVIPTSSTEGFAKAAADEREQLLSVINSSEVKGAVLFLSGDVHFSECQRFPAGSSNPKIVEITSSPLRISSIKNPRSPHPNRFWHTVQESFAIINIVFEGMVNDRATGTITIEACGADGVVLNNEEGGIGVCRTIWNLTTGRIS